MIEPRNVDLPNPSILRISWKDGTVQDLDARRLRLACPCAGCIEEWTGRKLLVEESVPSDIRIVTLDLVGRYALSFRWSDGHTTGIYSWPMLRALGTT